MQKYFAFLVTAFSLFSFSVRASEPSVISFEGQVKEGESYSHALPNGFIFDLLPQEDGGWKLAVTGHGKAKCSSPAYHCSGVADVSLSLDGPDQRIIQGRQFTRGAYLYNKDNPAFNTPLMRNFYYVLDSKDLARLMGAERCHAAGKPPCKEVNNFKAVKGVMHITSYKPPKLAYGGKSYLLSFIRFTVTQYPPATYGKQ